MSDKLKKAIGFFAVAVLFALAGVATLVFAAVPTWVPVVIDAVCAVLGIIGITVAAKPDV